MIGALLGVAKLFAGKIFSHGGADVIGKILHRDTAQTIADASVWKAEVNAGRDVAVEQIKASQNSWKDEFALGLISMPYIILFTIGTVGSLGALFNGDFDLALARFDQTIQHLANFPDWFTIGIFVPVILACFGIRVWNQQKK